MATVGGKTALGTAAGGVRETIQPLGQKPSGPFTHDRTLDANDLGHMGVRMPSRQAENDLPPTHQSGSKGGRPLPVFQGVTLLSGQDNTYA